VAYLRAFSIFYKRRKNKKYMGTKRPGSTDKRQEFNKDKFCTLEQYAAYFGITTRTAYNHYYGGRLKGAFKDIGGSNRILIPIEYIQTNPNPNVTIYATVPYSIENNREELDKEVIKLRRYCSAKCYKVQDIVTEYSYGIFEERPKLLSLLKNRYVKHVVVANKSAVNRYAFDFISAIMEADGRELEIISTKEPDDKGFKKDLTDTLYVVCKRLGTKDVTYEDVRKSMVALGIAERKNSGRPTKESKRTKNKTLNPEDLI
jgi:predicted site-specific integrase-resolvase